MLYEIVTMLLFAASHLRVGFSAHDGSDLQAGRQDGEPVNRAFNCLRACDDFSSIFWVSRLAKKLFTKSECHGKGLMIMVSIS